MKFKVAKRSKVRYPSNPLIESHEIVFRERTVKVGSARDLVDPETGEVAGMNAIYVRKVVDSERFAKIYLDGLSRTFGLGKAAMRVFQVILKLCGKDTDSLWLNFMEVSKIETMPKSTFYRGLRELIDAGFIAYSDVPNKFWANPHLFFNGDRVRFITEYVRRQQIEGKAAIAAEVEPAAEVQVLALGVGAPPHS